MTEIVARQDDLMARLIDIRSEMDVQGKNSAEAHDSTLAHLAMIESREDTHQTEASDPNRDPEEASNQKQHQPPSPREERRVGNDSRRLARYTAFVVNFPTHLPNEAIWNLFLPFGASDLHRRAVNGYAFIDFSTEHQLLEAIRHCKGHRFPGGHRSGIRVERARGKQTGDHQVAPAREAPAAPIAHPRPPAPADAERREQPAMSLLTLTFEQQCNRLAKIGRAHV